MRASGLDGGAGVGNEREPRSGLWEYTYLGVARTFFRGWYFWATHSQLPPMIKVARMLKAHLDNILTYLTHRVTNAITEGLNAKLRVDQIRRSWLSEPQCVHHGDPVPFCGGLDLEPRAV